MTPEELQEPLAEFQKTTDRLFALAWWADDDTFLAEFKQAAQVYTRASYQYRVALYEYAKTIHNPDVGEVFTQKADDLFVQTSFLITAVLGYRGRHKP